MRPPPIAAALLVAASAIAAPTAAQPPGHYSITFEYLTASYFDFKDGVGIADPSDQNSPCTALLLGLRGIQPLAETWELDQNMGTNLNGPGVGVSNLVPPLAAAGGWLPNSGGVNLGIPCPLPGSGTGSLWLVWSGMNWRSVQADSSTQLTLCSQETFASSSPGCLAVPDSAMRLWASACRWDDALFGADYTDGKGKYLGGIPFDLLHFKSDVIKCGAGNNLWTKTTDYTDTIQDFTAGGASQTFDIIKNEAVVMGFKWDVATPNTSYMAVCWRMTYLDFQDPLNPTTNVADTHDWKLLLDFQVLFFKFDLPWQIAHYLAALQRHYGGAIAGDNDVGGPAVAMRGFYSQDAGNPKSPGAGENGFPCSRTPDNDWQEKLKKPAPLV